MNDNNTSPPREIAYTIGCDQVAWILDIAERYIPQDNHPGISQEREMKKYAMLYEIMEITNTGFEDNAARNNGTPIQARSKL